MSDKPSIVYNISNQLDTIVSDTVHQAVYRNSIFESHQLSPTSEGFVEMTDLSSGLAYWVLGLGLLFLSIMHLSFRRRIAKSISAFFSLRKLNQLSEEGYLLLHPVQYSYMIFYVLLIAVFIQVFSPILGYQMLIVNFGIYALVIFLLVMLKVIMYYLSGVLYDSKQMGRLLIAHYATLFISSSYLVFPFLLSLLLYNQEWIGYTLLIILLILFIFRLFYSFWTIRQKINFSVYQIFLYLCALELAPAIILLKLVIQHVISF